MRTILAILVLYVILMSVYLWIKYTLIDDSQCGRCVSVCSVVCLENKPCGFGKYLTTYYESAYQGCYNSIDKYWKK